MFMSVNIKFAGITMIVVILSTLATISQAGEINGIGYSATDNTNYAWTEISQTGTHTISQSNTWQSTVDIGFDFDFYNQLNNQITISPDGLMGFGYLPYPDQPGVARMPYFEGSPHTYIATCMDSYSVDPTNPASGVYYQTSGAVGERQLIVQWQDMQRSGGGSATFQAILSEGSNAIKMQYQDMDFQINPNDDHNSQAVVGIQGDRGNIPTWLQWSGQTSVPQDSSAVLYSPRVIENPHNITINVTESDARVSVSTHSWAAIFVEPLNPPDPEDHEPFPGDPEHYEDFHNDSDYGSNQASCSSMSMVMWNPPDAEITLSVDAFAEAEARMSVETDGQTLYEGTMINGGTFEMRMGFDEYTSSNYNVDGHGMAEAFGGYSFDGEILVETSDSIPEGTPISLMLEGYDEDGVAHNLGTMEVLAGISTPIEFSTLGGEYDWEFPGSPISGSSVQWVTYTVPEPTTMTLLALGGLAVFRRKRQGHDI